MARIKLGPIVTDISGSIGGLTIQRNRFGMTMRAKPLPLYSETPAQYDIRRKIAFLQYSWQALTDAQRRQWNRFLDFSGQTIRRDRSVLLSGQTLYIKYQLWRLLYGQALLTTIAYAPMPDWEDILNIQLDGPLINLNFDGNIIHTSYFFIFKTTTPRNENQAYNPKGLRFMVVAFATDSSFNFALPYVQAFGALPPINSWLHYCLRYFSVISPVFTGIFTGKMKVTSPP